MYRQFTIQQFYVLLYQAFTFTQRAYLFKLVIPTTNTVSRWALNVETKTKRALHSSRRLSFNEITNSKNLVLHSSHFALNWHCCTAALGERSSGGIWTLRTSSFKCFVDHLHTLYSSGNIDVRNWVHLFESRCILLEDLCTTGIGLYYKKMTTAGGKLQYEWMSE